MKRIALLASCLVLAVTSSGVDARPAAETTAMTIDFAAFMKISEEVIKVRPQRLLALDDFLVRAADPDASLRCTPSEPVGYDGGGLHGRRR